MRTFKVTNGDIAVRDDGNIEMVEGADRISQELTHWTLEPVGTDSIYKSFGSYLHEHIGTLINHDSLLEVRAEVIRVVNNYIAYQERQIEDYKNNDIASFVNSWSNDDIISSVNHVDVTAQGDTVNVNVKVTTQSGKPLEISEVL